MSCRGQGRGVVRGRGALGLEVGVLLGEVGVLLVEVGVSCLEAQCASLVSAQFVEVGGCVVVDAQCASLVSAQFVEAQCVLSVDAQFASCVTRFVVGRGFDGTGVGGGLLVGLL